MTSPPSPPNFFNICIFPRSQRQATTFYIIMPRRVANKPGSQSTLSFGGGRVTKPVTAPSHKAKALDSTPALSDKSASATPEPQQLSVTPNEPSKPHVAELAVRQQAATEHQAPRSEEDKRALKLNKQDIWRYWRAQEQTRKAPRGKLILSHKGLV